MVYNYDLISGKVNQVSYQPHQADAYYHQYSYDAENRITAVRTSTDSSQWQNDANYTYYRHGPLARVQLGDLRLQGIDYAYTVQGWLKSINPSWVTPTGSADQFDSDGMSGQILFERDAYKLNLNYFDDGTYTDYMPVSPQPGYVQGNSLLSTAKHNLYNGNISSMAVNIRQLWATPGKRDAGPMLYNYSYDQLNRISSMDAWAANGSFQPINTSPLIDYAERYTYDPNGNIMTLNRNGDSVNQAMDQLTYKYIYAKTGSGGNGEYVPGSAPTTGVAHLTNQLSSITDAVTSNNYAGDIKTQPAFNYTYDAIGELTGDGQQLISNVTWNVYGKILSLSDSGNTISFTYDAAGNRISKAVTNNTTNITVTTWYVRDAQGNVMSVYTHGNSAINSGSLTQAEADLYGSSRLGLLDLSVNCGTSLTQPTLRSLVRGSKLFELTNHLGNVLETISDKKIQHTSDNSTVDYYLADVINANDYYSFGMGMPTRSYTAASAANYRYGFNGKEQDPEVKGTGNQYDYGMRMYDPRVGKFLSVDPMTRKYPWLTPYQFAENDVIRSTDLDGLEKQVAINGSVVYGPVNMNAVNGAILSNYTKAQQTAMKQADAEKYIQGFNRTHPQQVAHQSSSDRIESQETALFRQYLNDPDNIGGQAAYAIANNLHDARTSFKDGDWWNGTLDFLNAGINTVTLAGAGEALGVKVKTEVKTEGLFVYADAGNQGKTIGLGLFSELPNHRGTGAITYKNAGWQEAGLTKVDWGRASMDNYYFMESFRDAAKNAEAIRFDVTNFEPFREKPQITNFEFNHIVGDKELLKKTTFIREGKTVEWNGKTFEEKK